MGQPSHPGWVAWPRKGPGQQLGEGRARETQPPVAPPYSCRTGQSASHPHTPALLHSCWVVSGWVFIPPHILPLFCLQQPLGGGQQICWRRRFPGPHGLAARAEKLELVPPEHSPLGPSLGMEVGVLVVGSDLVLLCLMLKPIASSLRLGPKKWVYNSPCLNLGPLTFYAAGEQGGGGMWPTQRSVLTKGSTGPRRRSCGKARKGEGQG